MNIVLITIDALRFDHGLDLFRLLKRKMNLAYLLYNNHYTNGAVTLSSFPAMMTSTPFLLHENLTIEPLIKTLPHQLANKGYETIGFNTNPVLSCISGLFKGFHKLFFPRFKGSSTRYATRMFIPFKRKLFNRRTVGPLYTLRQSLEYYKLLFKTDEVYPPYVRARELTLAVIQELNNILKNERNKKIFLWINYMDCHRPYVPPSNYIRGSCSSKQAFFHSLPTAGCNILINNSFSIKKARELYVRSVFYIYDALSEFIDFLNDKKIIEDSLIIITSDHGEAFGEHGRTEHFWDLLYNETIHVPLIIFHPKVEDHIITYTTDHMGLMPTLFDILGKKVGSSLVMGKSFWKRKVSPVYVVSFPAFIINNGQREDEFALSVIKDGWKVIYKLENKGSRLQVSNIELYNLKNDPLEKINLADGEPSITWMLIRMGIEYLLSVLSLKRKLKKIHTTVYKFKLRKFSTKLNRLLIRNYNARWAL